MNITHRKNPFSLGSVSEGTLRPEDLFPRYYESWFELASSAEGYGYPEGRDLEGHAYEVWKSQPELLDFECVLWDEIIQDLENSICELLPAFVTFGGTPYDPACIGYWFDFECFEQSRACGEVWCSDELPDEWPTDESGELYEYVAIISDHGNIALYCYHLDTDTAEEFISVA